MMNHERGNRWMPLGTSLVVAAVPLLCLAPFVFKPFHMDDLTYLWPARHILDHPTDFFGFTANWYGFEAPMWRMNMNPPLVSYFIALAAVLIGWSEVGLHLAFLIPAVGVSLGTYHLARSLCQKPLLAVLVAVLTPVFLVSGTNIMCDILMLAFFVWAAALWVRGLDEDRCSYLLAASFSISLSALTKYFGLSMAPLLLVYSMAKLGRMDRRMLFLAIPVLAVLGYECLTWRLYGTGLLTDAAAYATTAAESRNWTLATRALIGLSFTGGCLTSVAFCFPLLWSRGLLLVAGLVLAAVAAVLVSMGTVGDFVLAGPEGIRWGLMVQTALFVTAGIHVLALACSDTFRKRDAGSLLLMLWILGTFVFTSFLNWSTNARTVLPMVPAAGILVGRRLERMSDSVGNYSSLLMSVPLIASACLALAVSWADFSLASCQRSAATEVMRALRDCTRPVWFQGHWGFQYYMEAHNCRPVDLRNPRIEQGDVVVVPSNNANVAELAKDWFHLVERTRCRPFSWLGTVQKNLGAGFYSDRWGPLPFAVGRVQPEEYRVFLVGAYADPAAAVREFRAECLR